MLRNLELQIPTTSLIVAIDAQRDLLEVENESSISNGIMTFNELHKVTSGIM